MNDGPHRRADDCVSYKDMVDYVSEHDAAMHAARAESMLLFGRALEKIEAAWERHETYHRDYLSNAMSQGASIRVAIVAIIVAALMAASSVVVGVISLSRAHG